MVAYDQGRVTSRGAEIVSHEEQILASLDEGFNCAESMVVAFADTVDLPRDVGMRAATGFGGGMGRTGNVCGLVSGAVLVLGWSVGRNDPTDAESKKRAYDAVAKLIGGLKTSRDSIRCPEILGADFATDEKRRACAIEAGDFKRRCRAVAGEIAVILERLLVSSGS